MAATYCISIVYIQDGTGGILLRGTIGHLVNQEGTNDACAVQLC
jgi:hypothetical protein